MCLWVFGVRLISLFLPPKTRRWACADKTAVCLYQISSTVIPEAGTMLQPIPLSVWSPIKLWLQSKIVSLYQIYFISEGPLHLRDMALWQLIDLYSGFLCFCFFFPSPPRKKRLKMEQILVHRRSSCVCVCFLHWLQVVLRLLFVKSGQHFLFQFQFYILHADQSMTMYELKSSITMSPFSVLVYLSVLCIMCVFDVIVCVCVVWWQIDVFVFPLLFSILCFMLLFGQA